MKVATSQPLNDSSGIIFFGWYSDGVTAQTFLSSSDSAVDNQYISFEELAGGKIRLLTNLGGVINDITSTNTAVVGYNICYFKSTGTAYELSLNKTVETKIVVSGADDGTFFADILGRDGLTISSIQKLTPVIRGAEKNKIIYSNTNLTSAEISDINNFMFNTNN